MLSFVSFQLPYNIHLLFSCIVSIFALTLLVLGALFCPLIRNDSLCLLRFPFLSHAQVVSYEISLVCCLTFLTLVFLPISVSLFLLIYWYFFSGLFLVAVISISLLFLCSLRVVVSTHPRFFSLLFLTRLVCHLSNVKHYASL